MRKTILVAIMSIIIALVVCVPFASATTLTLTNVKGASALFIIPNDDQTNHPGNSLVYMLLSESNDGKNGQLMVTVIHFANTAHPLVSRATASVDFKWNMDHITVSVPMTFTGPLSGPHTIDLTFNALPKSQGVTPSGDITIDGSWKSANAGLMIDGNAGPHGNLGPDGTPVPFMTDTATIFHGDFTFSN
jgi:hypothetical protein